MDTWFPNPQEQAINLLDAVDNDVDEARRLARENAVDAPTHDGFLYWATVARSCPKTGVPAMDLMIAAHCLTPREEMN